MVSLQQHCKGSILLLSSFLQMREMKTPIHAESYLSSCSVVARLAFELGWPHMKIKPLTLQMNRLKSQGHLPHQLQILEHRASEFVTSVLRMTRRSTVKSRLCLWSLPFWGHPAYCHSTTCSNSQALNTHTYPCFGFPLTTDDGPRLCPSWPLISLAWIPQSSRTAPLTPAGTRYMLSSLHFYSPFPTVGLLSSCQSYRSKWYLSFRPIGNATSLMKLVKLCRICCSCWGLRDSGERKWGGTQENSSEAWKWV